MRGRFCFIRKFERFVLQIVKNILPKFMLSTGQEWQLVRKLSAFQWTLITDWLALSSFIKHKQKATAIARENSRRTSDGFRPHKSLSRGV